MLVLGAGLGLVGLAWGAGSCQPGNSISTRSSSSMSHGPVSQSACSRFPHSAQVVASSLDTLDSVLLDDFACKDDLSECLKVGCSG